MKGRLPLMIPLWIALVAPWSAAWPAAESEAPQFPAREHPLEAVDAALARAAATERRLLVVLGANWCHDSRALASRLESPELGPILEGGFETVLVDVGYLEHGFDVVRRFGVSMYYATPTVLVVDPESEQLVNADDRHQWGNAFRITLDETVAYFQHMAAVAVAPPVRVTTPAEHRAALMRIEARAEQLDQRVASGFAAIGPELREHKMGDTPEGFFDRWDEFSAFRQSVPLEIEGLRASLAEHGPASIPRDFPTPAPFSWEVR